MERDRNRARLETIDVLDQAEALALRRGAINAANYLHETLESLTDRWWPEAKELLRKVAQSFPRDLQH